MCMPSSIAMILPRTVWASHVIDLACNRCNIIVACVYIRTLPLIEFIPGWIKARCCSGNWTSPASPTRLTLHIHIQPLEWPH
jgi:hypothetical protein